jgi:hypothetical protein
MRSFIIFALQKPYLRLQFVHKEGLGKISYADVNWIELANDRIQ